MSPNKITLDVQCPKDIEIQEFVHYLGKTLGTQRVYELEEHRRRCASCDSKIKRYIIDAMNGAVLPYVY